MRLMVISCFSILMASCTPPVHVETVPASPPSVVLNVVNTLGIPVNVYLVGGDGNSTLLGQVGSNVSRELAIRDHNPGDQVSLKAMRVDGSTTYTRSGFVLSRRSEWRLP